MPPHAFLKRARRRKFKAKARLPFGSRSSGPRNLPSRMKADLPDLFARLEMQQKGEDGVLRCDDSEDRTKDAACCSNEETVPTAEKAGAASDALTDSDAEDIARLLRKALKKNGPSLEDDLLSALSPSQVQCVIHAYGTLAAFMDHLPEFELAQEGRYIFVCYEDLDGE
ncbi:hypothetical protein MTO96_048670 [Rhipicephalus appendiculatus]